MRSSGGGRPGLWGHLTQAAGTTGPVGAPHPSAGAGRACGGASPKRRGLYEYSTEASSVDRRRVDLSFASTTSNAPGSNRRLTRASLLTRLSRPLPRFAGTADRRTEPVCGGSRGRMSNDGNSDVRSVPKRGPNQAPVPNAQPLAVGAESIHPVRSLERVHGKIGSAPRHPEKGPLNPPTLPHSAELHVPAGGTGCGCRSTPAAIVRRADRVRPTRSRMGRPANSVDAGRRCCSLIREPGCLILVDRFRRPRSSDGGATSTLLRSVS